MTEIRLYYATNRRHVGPDRWHPTGYAAETSKDGAENLRFGHVTLEYDADQAARLLGADSGFGAGNGEDLAAYLYRKRSSAQIEAFEEKLEKTVPDDRQPKAKFGSSRTFGELQREMRGGRDVLIYLHGFNVSWWSAVATAMSLQLMLNRDPGSKPLLVVLFTWPSDGASIPYWSYFSDRSDAALSGGAVGRGFLKLRDFLIDARREDAQAGVEPCRQSIHLLCHSMGNYVLQNALKRTEEFSVGGKPPRIFSQVFLCAADVADDVFEPDKPLRRLPELAEQVTIYYNGEDVAMPVSDYTKGNTDRLGWRGANRPAELDARVHQVDCTPIVTGLIEHSYYLCGRVNSDIRRSIDRISPDDPSRDRAAVRNGWPNAWRMR